MQINFKCKEKKHSNFKSACTVQKANLKSVYYFLKKN